MMKHKKLLLGLLSVVMMVALAFGFTFSASADGASNNVVVAENATQVAIFNPESVESTAYTEYSGGWGGCDLNQSGLTTFAPDDATGVSYDYMVPGRGLGGIAFEAIDITSVGATESDIVLAFDLYISNMEILSFYDGGDTGLYLLSNPDVDGWGLSQSNEILFSTLTAAGLSEGWNRIYFPMDATSIRAASGFNLSQVRRIMFAFISNPEMGISRGYFDVILNNMRAIKKSDVTLNGSTITGVVIESLTPAVGSGKTFIDTSFSDVQYAGGAMVAQKSDVVPYEYKNNSFVPVAEDSYKISVGSSDLYTKLRAANCEAGFDIGNFNLNKAYLETYMYIDATDVALLADTSAYTEAYMQIDWNIARLDIGGTLGADNNLCSVYTKWAIGSLNLQAGWNKVRLGIDLSMVGVNGAYGAGLQRFMANIYSFGIYFTGSTEMLDLYMTDINMVQGDQAVVTYRTEDFKDYNFADANLYDTCAERFAERFASSSVLSSISSITTDLTAGSDGIDYVTTLSDSNALTVNAEYKLSDNTVISNEAKTEIATLSVLMGDRNNATIEGLTATFTANGTYTLMLGNTLNDTAVSIQVTVNAYKSVSFSGVTESAQNVLSEQKATKPADPTKEGFVFGGWYSDEACTTEFNFDSAITADTVIYAKWTEVFDVTFSGVTESAQNVLSGQKATKPADPTKEGFVFGGWYSDEACTTEFNFDSAITVDTVIYAKWMEVFDVTFSGATESAQNVLSGQKATKPADPTKEGFTFAGWYSDEACTTEFNFDSAITADTVIYAKWTEVKESGCISNVNASAIVIAVITMIAAVAVIAKKSRV